MSAGGDGEAEEAEAGEAAQLMDTSAARVAMRVAHHARKAVADAATAKGQAEVFQRRMERCVRMTHLYIYKF